LAVRELNYWHKHYQDPINIMTSHIINIAHPWHAIKLILYNTKHHMPKQ
jgi:hypothetical protein